MTLPPPPPLKETVLEQNGYQKWKEFDKVSKIAYYETNDGGGKKAGFECWIAETTCPSDNFYLCKSFIF